MSFFVYNSLGFFLQFFPCALITFVPFSEDSLRVRRKVIFIGLTIASLLLTPGFPAIQHIAIATWGSTAGGVAANIYALLAELLGLAAFLWLVRETLLKKLMVFFIVMFYGATQYWVVNLWLYLTNFPVADLVGNYTGSIVLMYAVTTVIMLPLMIAMVIRPVGEFLQDIKSGMMRREFCLVIFSTLTYIILMFCLSTLWRVNAERESWLLYSVVFLFLMLNQFLIFWLVFRESVRRKRDDDQRRALEIQQFQYEKIASEIESTQRMRHDLRHHYNALSDMLEHEKYDEMRTYLSKVFNDNVRRMGEVYCRNMTVNGLLQYYVGLARDENIRCDIHAECGDLAVDPVDLTVLFGNAMENAIRACQKCPENRWIDLRVGIVSGSLAIEISNSCKGVQFNRRFQTEDGFSPAEAFQSDRIGGGYGLRSLSYTAKKYDGSARFRFNAETETFTTRIRLNVKTN